MRTSGVLMPISSLPSQYGIGDFGESCYRLVDLLKTCGFKCWQILPLNPLGFGNSPYQAYSSKAMDELYISLELLEEKGYEVEQVAILRVRDGEYDIKIIQREQMNEYIEIFNKLTELFYLVYELNNDWGDLL